MILLVRLCADRMTQLPRLKAKVTGQSNRIYTWISSHPLVRFSLKIIEMLLSESCCAELMTQLHRPKVPAQGHGFYPWILCQLNISWTIWTIFIKLQSQWDSEQSLCRLKVKVTVKGQGIYPWIMCLLHISISLLECSSHWVGVQNPWLSYAKSRSHFMVMDFCDGGYGCPSDCFLVQEGLSVTCESVCTNYSLTTCPSLPRKKCG